jgi:nicotinamidase-related amidase
VTQGTIVAVSNSFVMADLVINPQHSALLVMDFQTAIVERVVHGHGALLDATAAAIAAARESSIQVIYVLVGFRPGFPEVSPRNQSFATIKASGGISSDIHPRVAPRSNEVVVTKHRVGAFFGTDLDMILRANDIDTLVLCGIATSGVVLSTLRHAADSDYRIIVLSDCCFDSDPEVHACLMNKVFPRQAAVTDSREFISALQ